MRVNLFQRGLVGSLEVHFVYEEYVSIVADVLIFMFDVITVSF